MSGSDCFPTQTAIGRANAIDSSILSWIEFVGRLKTTGMPIREMLGYAALRDRGAATRSERRELLERHREKVRTHVAALQACLLVLDSKIAGYLHSKQRIKINDARHISAGKPVRSGRPRSI
jgi:hypothetical protein